MSAAAVRPDQGKLPRNGKTRVLIATDHAATRAGVRLALERDSICFEADSAGAAVDSAIRDRPDLCLIAVKMGGGHNGIEAAAEISARLPHAAIVMLSDEPDLREFFESVRAGANGYVSDQIDPARLPHVVRGVLNGEAAVPRKLVARLIDELRSRDRRRSLLVEHNRSIDLTRREWEVLELLRASYTTREMSVELKISEVTVRRHISMLMHKLDVPDRRSALALLKNADQTA